ncbi:MAG: NTP transferase domain-containing protein [Actinomycetota bacterium]|nr:NTP transferase domain-containing protein [Actinomycetota bacterium]
MVFDAIVLAGGRATRMGGIGKPLLRVAGVTLLDMALGAAAGARSLVVVGPADLPVPERVQLVREDPPFGGPAAALAEGLKPLRRNEPAPWVLVLAADQPAAGLVVPALLAAGDTPLPSDAVIAVDRAGRRQLLMALYRSTALATAVGTAERSAAGISGLPMHRLVAGLSVVEIVLPANVALAAAALGTDRPEVAGPDVAGPPGPKGNTKPADVDRVDIDTWDDAARWGAELG